MSSLQRVGNILLGLIMVAGAIILWAIPEYGFVIIATVLGFSLIVYGIKMLVQYARLARHMVGGKSLLFIGVITMDLGSLAYMVAGEGKTYVVLYLIGSHLVVGVLGILRAREAKQLDSAWQLPMCLGVGNVLIAIACVVFLGSPNVLIGIYCIGLVYSAIIRIVSAFKNNDIVYVA